jgi:hypothetical protein
MTEITKEDCPEQYDKPDCKNCMVEDCQDGRYLPAVNEYASTCDGCAELTSHEEMVMDKNTQLGYCEICVENKVLPDDFAQA